jgi:hypothetical protein
MEDNVTKATLKRWAERLGLALARPLERYRDRMHAKHPEMCAAGTCRHGRDG